MAEAVFAEEFSGDDVVLSTSAIIILTASPRASASEPEVYIVQNNHATAVITVGGANVGDESNGVVLPTNGNNSVSIPMRSPGAVVYAIADTGTPSIQVTRA